MSEPALDQLLAAYGAMRLTRALDQAIRNLWMTGKGVGGTFNQIGHEAISCGSALCLGPDDIIAPLHRDLGAYLVRGMSARRLMANQLGRADGVSAGRDANLHGCGDLSLGIIGFISHLPQAMAAAVGAGIAFAHRDEARVAMAYVGDGGAITGLFTESLNLAQLRDARVVVVVENNQYAFSTPLHQHSANPDIAARVSALGLHVVDIDGTDVGSVMAACSEAVDRARAGAGPAVVVANTMRMLGHAIQDGADYVPRELLAQWADRDPLVLLGQRLLAFGMTESRLLAMDGDARTVVADAVSYAEASPWPDPATLLDGVWA